MRVTRAWALRRSEPVAQILTRPLHPNALVFYQEGDIETWDVASARMLKHWTARGPGVGGRHRFRGQWVGSNVLLHDDTVLRMWTERGEAVAAKEIGPNIRSVAVLNQSRCSFAVSRGRGVVDFLSRSLEVLASAQLTPSFAWEILPRGEDELLVGQQEHVVKLQCSTGQVTGSVAVPLREAPTPRGTKHCHLSCLRSFRDEVLLETLPVAIYKLECSKMTLQRAIEGSYVGQAMDRLWISSLDGLRVYRDVPGQAGDDFVLVRGILPQAQPRVVFSSGRDSVVFVAGSDRVWTVSGPSSASPVEWQAPAEIQAEAAGPFGGMLLAAGGKMLFCEVK